ncbi:MAG: ribosome-associated translation inhibitor RaiA [Alphaproteobacteria bacterium]|jgi:ribosomal subunit interface protein|nr:ribosome-associated translation inhibitor RaiA [Alphaproteobacteria bacterium]
MNISVKGVKVSVSQSMKEDFVSRVSLLCEKYFGKVISATVSLELDHADKVEAKITVHPAEKKEFFSSASADQMKDAFADALTKLDSQLNKDHAKSAKH